jgi:hypothetical protein
MRRIITPTVVAALVLAVAGCGKSNIVAVRRPVLPIYYCLGRDEHAGEHCRGEFNAALLIGLTLAKASSLAKSHGYVVRREAPVRGWFFDDLVNSSNRIDVECNDASDNCVVVRIIGTG